MGSLHSVNRHPSFYHRDYPSSWPRIASLPTARRSFDFLARHTAASYIFQSQLIQAIACQAPEGPDITEAIAELSKP